MISTAGRVLALDSSCVSQIRMLGRRPPKQGKPPVLPPSKKVLYHVVHVPWQKPQDVQDLLWRRLVYNNSVTSLREVFRAELQKTANTGQGLDAMREAEENEFNELIKLNEQKNKQKAEMRVMREKKEWKETQKIILEEIDETLQKQRAEQVKADAEVRAAIERSRDFVTRENLNESILKALENPVIYDYAINRKGEQFFDPTPVKYQEGTPTRQKGRIYDRTLGGPQTHTPMETSDHNQGSASP